MRNCFILLFILITLSLASYVIAIEEIEGTISDAPVSTEDLLNQAEDLYDNNDFEGSIEIYKQILETESNNSEVLWKLGRSYVDVGEDMQDAIPKDASKKEKKAPLQYYETAKGYLEQSISIKEDEADAHFELARASGRIALFKGIWSVSGLVKAAKREIERTLELDPEYDGAWHFLGRWHRNVAQKSILIRKPLGLGSANKDEGIECFKKAIELAPDILNHHFELGKSYIDKKKWDEAKSELEIALTCEDDDRKNPKRRELAEQWIELLDEGVHKKNKYYKE